MIQADAGGPASGDSWHMRWLAAWEGPPRPVGCWIVSGAGNRTENAEEPAPEGGFFAWAGLGVSV